MENTENLPETITDMFYTGNLPPTKGEIIVLKIKGCTNKCDIMLLQHFAANFELGEGYTNNCILWQYVPLMSGGGQILFLMLKKKQGKNCGNNLWQPC